MTATLLLLAAALAAPQPGPEGSFGEWVSGCDNVGTCEAVALIPEGGSDTDAWTTLVVTESRGGYTLDFDQIAGLPDRWTLVVDGRVIARQGADKTENLIWIGDAGALKAFRNGRKLTLRDAKGQNVGDVTLKGSAAALLWMKDKGARLRRANATLPMVPRATPVLQGAVPGTAELVAFAETSPCTEYRDEGGITEDRAWSLGTRDGIERAVVLIACGAGAYNFSSGAYLATRDVSRPNARTRWVFAPAPFDFQPDWADPKAKPDPDAMPSNTLVNASFDATTMQLDGFAKGRGPGDCGETVEYVWDGTRFRLIKATRMQRCQGSLNWLTLWRAQVGGAAALKGKE